MKKRNKSDSYQHKIIEITVDPVVFNDLASDTGLGAQVNLAMHSEEFYDLRQQLIEEITNIIDKHLTKRQAEVIKLRLEGKTQIQIAEQLNIHQTTVHKLLSGNIDYSNGRKRYGGAIKKLQKMCDKNCRVIFLLKRMDDLKTRDPLDELNDN